MASSRVHHCLLAVLVLLFWGAPFARAQQLGSLEEKYQLFLSQRKSQEQEKSFQTLMECYEGYTALLKSVSHDHPDYIQAKKALRSLRPYMQIAAGYYSSKRDQPSALPFAQAFVDIPMMEAFATDRFAQDEDYPTMVYFAASGTYNAGDYRRALGYFSEYLRTGDEKFRQTVCTAQAKVLIDLKEYDAAIQALEESSAHYPDDFLLLSMAINTCIEQEDRVRLQPFLTRALKLQPEDETLLSIQGKVYEDNYDFQNALVIYRHLSQLKPSNLSIRQHIALNNYNLGVLYYNRASTEESEEEAQKLQLQAEDYFYAAVESLQEVLSNNPSALKYAEALANTYNCLHDPYNLERVNQRILALGGTPVENDNTPTLISYQTPVVASGIADNAPKKVESTPLYSVFAKEYVEKELNSWQEKDPYETLSEYRSRVTAETRDAKIQELLKEAEARYIARYSKDVNMKDLTLMPYDAEHNAFLVKSPYGDLVVPVPRQNNEARLFEANWGHMRVNNPEFYISDNQLLLSSLTFLTPTGKTYTYRGDSRLNYTETKIDLNFNPITENAIASTMDSAPSGRPVIETVRTSIGTSDVDENIPDTGILQENTFAVIIANENYSMVSHVPCALNDGKVFSQYCTRTLGISEDHIRMYPDATYGTMLRAIAGIRDIAKAFDGNINIIFYYAGHGIPNESTRDAFLLPIDSDARQTEGCYPLERLYKDLAETNAESTVVFLDACFSGAARDDSEHMLASARGVGLSADMKGPSGNIVVFSAASEDQTAYPYKEKNHGIFTYYLLKKLQETEGNVTLGELADYISRQVRQQSVIVNHKLQSPNVIPSPGIASYWQNIVL